MTIYEMKEKIKKVFGETSLEYGFFTRCFARRPSDYTKKVYYHLMKNAAVV